MSSHLINVESARPGMGCWFHIKCQLQWMGLDVQTPEWDQCWSQSQITEKRWLDLWSPIWEQPGSTIQYMLLYKTMVWGAWAVLEEEWGDTPLSYLGQCRGIIKKKAPQMHSNTNELVSTILRKKVEAESAEFKTECVPSNWPEKMDQLNTFHIRKKWTKKGKKCKT